MQAAQRKVVYYELVENLHSRKKKRLTNHLVFQFPSPGFIHFQHKNWKRQKMPPASGR